MNKPEVIEQMDELAVIIGIVSQIRNDVRDLTRWDLKNDLLQKKRTLPVLFLLADEEGYQPFRDYYNGNISQAEFLLHKQACLSYIQQSGCIEYCSVIQTLFLNRAEQLLEALDIPLEAKDRFRKLTLGSPKADPSAAMAEVQISS